MKYILTVCNPDLTFSQREQCYEQRVEVLVHNVMKGDKGDKGDSGITTYTELTDKPQINGNTLVGNKSASDLGIAAKEYVDSETERARAAEEALMALVTDIATTEDIDNLFN